MANPSFLYRESDRAEALVRLAAAQLLAPGRHKVTVSFTVDGPGFGRGGKLELLVNGRQAGAHGSVQVFAR